jgi:hypothetical protein
MIVPRVLAVLLGSALPFGLALAGLRRAGRHGPVAPDAAALALGALAYAVAAVVEGALTDATGVSRHVGASSDPAVLAYAFLVAAPLEQGLKLAAFLPVWRARATSDRRAAVVRAALVALGFVTARSARELATTGTGAWAVAGAFVSVPAHLFFAAAWGYVLGRDPHKRLGGRAFDATWLAAMVFNGVFDHLAFELGPGALVATVPMLAAMGLGALAGARAITERERRDASHAPRPRRFLRAVAPPSMDAVRDALRRAERPVTLGWVAFGALVTTGVMTVLLAASVLLGHRLGVDFAAVDRGESSQGGAAPLLLLGSAALVAFPIAGYLVARASATRSVVEPALSAALAILGSLVLLGLAAPISLVFAIAFAPVAFGLACGGAWMGMGR